jgi:hypothetical protein
MPHPTNPAPITTLKIECVFGLDLTDPFERTVEVASDLSLGALHLLIQRLTGFANDHLVTFYTASSVRARNRREVVEADGEDERAAGLERVRLAQVFPLPRDRKLFYRFDFGDDWRFQITRRGEPKPAEPGVTYPRVI